MNGYETDEDGNVYIYDELELVGGNRYMVSFEIIPSSDGEYRVMNVEDNINSMSVENMVVRELG